jgi:4a-hydroxytetrahydrobiopterin dehydratase
MELAKQKCIPCEGGVPPLRGEELTAYKTQLDTEAPGWEMKNAKQLSQTFRFPDFQEAMSFANQVGAEAEAEGHHPNIEFGWGFARVLIWTHAIDGLSQADFALAAKVSRLMQV